jgi:hypothetical protein
MSVTATGTVDERNTFDLYFNQKLTLKDGAMVVRSLIATATLKITLKSNPATVVNSRTALNVADSFNEQGEFLCKLSKDDAVILSSVPIASETHVATLTVITNGAEPQQIIKEIEFDVVNLATVS